MLREDWQKQPLPEQLKHALSVVAMYRSAIGESYLAKKQNIQARREALQKEEALIDRVHHEAKSGKLLQAERIVATIEVEIDKRKASGAGAFQKASTVSRKIRKLDKLREKLAELEKEILKGG